jgi:hypothetical protein
MSETAARQRNTAAIAASAIAIVALVLTFVPLMGLLSVLGYTGLLLMFLAIPLSIAAIVLGAVGLVRSSALGGIGVPMACLGIIGGIVAPLGSLAWLLAGLFNPRLLIGSGGRPTIQGAGPSFVRSRGRES